jgi:hypothetical protein
MELCDFSFRDEVLKHYIQLVSSKISKEPQRNPCDEALLYIGAIVHCFTEHRSDFAANGIVGDMQALNCNDLDRWGFSKDLQTSFIQQNRKIKTRLENEATISFIGRPDARLLNVPLNPRRLDNLIPSCIGTLRPTLLSMLDAFHFTNALR